MEIVQESDVEQYNAPTIEDLGSVAELTQANISSKHHSKPGWGTS